MDKILPGKEAVFMVRDDYIPDGGDNMVQVRGSEGMAI